MIKRVLTIMIGLFFIPTVSFAATSQEVAPLIDSIDMVWMMLGAFLVFFMHAGFAMVETGFTRSKNALNILMKNMMTIAIASVLYFLIGFGLMFGNTLGGFVGTSGFFLQGQVDQIGFFVFQAMFAATCATIISGAVAERIKLSSYLLLTIFMTGLIYPIVGHWLLVTGSGGTVGWQV